MVSPLASRCATPEQNLLYTIVKMAVEDLSSDDEQDKFDAHEFLFQPHGDWAEQRRMFFDALDIDEEDFQKRIAYLFDPPERPAKKWTMLEVYDVLPEEPFKAADMGRVIGLRYSQMTARFQHLMKMGLLTRLERGRFIRTDCYDKWLDDLVAPDEPKPEDGPTQHSQAALLNVLKDGPKTIREMLFAFDGEIGQDAIRQRLERARARKLVEKEGPKWKMAA